MPALCLIDYNLAMEMIDHKICWLNGYGGWSNRKISVDMTANVLMRVIWR